MRLGLLFLVSLVITFCSCHAQCVTHISPLPIDPPGKPIETPVGAKLSEREFVHTDVPLIGKDRLLLYALHNDSPRTGYSERGILITRNGRVIKQFALKSLAELKTDPKDHDFDPSDSFQSLSLTTLCSNTGALYLLAFHWQGDITSPELFLLITSHDDAFEVTALPEIDGGILDVSRSIPRHFRAWDSLFEGECNACKTHYEVREYELVDDRPIFRYKWRPKKRYSSGDFDDRLGVRLVR